MESCRTYIIQPNVCRHLTITVKCGPQPVATNVEATTCLECSLHKALTPTTLENIWDEVECRLCTKLSDTLEVKWSQMVYFNSHGFGKGTSDGQRYTLPSSDGHIHYDQRYTLPYSCGPSPNCCPKVGSTQLFQMSLYGLALSFLHWNYWI